MLRRIAQLDVATVDAALETATYRLVATFNVLLVSNLAPDNARRAVAGSAVLSGATLLLLRAFAASSPCTALSNFWYVLVYPTSVQGLLIIYRLHVGTAITPGQWVCYGVLLAAAVAWAAAKIMCDGEAYVLGFLAALLGLVVVVQVPVVTDMRPRHLIPYILYLLFLCAIIWLTF